MINAAVQVARKGETDHAKVMLLGIIALALAEMNKSLNRIETRIGEQDATFAHLMQTVSEIVNGASAFAGDEDNQ